MWGEHEAPLRRLPEVRHSGDVVWFQPALDHLRTFGRSASTDAPIYIARAPGRLDVMGGIADYSGAHVLELPIACSTAVVLQRQVEPRCDIATRRRDGWHHCSIALPLPAPDALTAWFAERETERWASYVVGVIQACLHQVADEGRATPSGLRLRIDSSVPEGRGVASSAALEVATGMAVLASCAIRMGAENLAALCQRVENHIVGAPCGIMDQMTAACGRRDRLLRLHCQPGTIEGFVEIPAGYRFYGIDSGVSHAVSGADYGTVRTAAFMGYRLIAAAAGLGATMDGPRLRIDDPRWHGCLANVTPSELLAFSPALPDAMSGAEFLERYGATTDSATAVRPERQYPVRRATEHPVQEEARVLRFAALLQELGQRPAAAIDLGQLMYDSHRSYSACGLGSDGTDRLVELVRAQGPGRGLFGAKITGGGSGGTVAVFGTSEAEPLVRDVAARYCAETGRETQLFMESGPGAAETGVLQLE